jgi:hypothetical protein
MFSYFILGGPITFFHGGLFLAGHALGRANFPAFGLCMARTGPIYDARFMMARFMMARFPITNSLDGLEKVSWPGKNIRVFSTGPKDPSISISPLLVSPRGGLSPSHHTKNTTLYSSTRLHD